MAMKSSSAWWAKVRRRITTGTADATDNLYIRDTVGNKTDAAVTTVGTTKSLMAYVKGIITNIAALGASNVATTTAGTIIQDGTNGIPNVITLTHHDSPDTFGSWVTIDASVSTDVWISHVAIAPVAVTLLTQSFCIEIGTGVSPTTIIRFSFSQSHSSGAGNDSDYVLYPIIFTLPIPIKVASGTAISGRMASTDGGYDVKVGISYYTGL